MDTDEKPQSSHRATGGKGRHHAWDKHIVKRDRSQATFGKFIVNPEKLTKKQLARLTRINDDQSEFAINVMYSLNRKYRWEQLWGAGNAIEADADVFPDNVKVDGCDGAYALAHDVVIKGHYERTEDGNVETTTNRAFWLADPAHYCIRRNKDKPLDEDGKVIPEVRYVQAATTDKRYADFKHLTWNTPWQWKRGKMFHRFELDQWGDDAKGCKDDNNDPKAAAGGPDSDDGNDDDTESTPPRPNTFTLADFVVDNRSPPTASSSELTLGSYDLASDSTDFGADYTSLVDVTGLCKDSFFTEFTCDASQLGCSDAAFKSLDSSNFAFQWLNPAKTSCAINLSEKLHPAEQDVVAVIVIEQLKSKKLRVILNGSFPIDEVSLLKSFDSTHFDSLPKFLETCTTKLSKSYETSCLSTTRDAYDCQSSFHPKELITASGIKKQTPPKFAEISKVADIADGFEVINLGKTETPSCAKCDSSEAPVYRAFNTCFHNFCRECFQSELTTAIECHKASPLKCLKTDCTALVRDEFLYVLLPLPVANFYFNEQLKNSAINAGKKLIECPHCESMATIDSPPKFNSLACWNCSMCFCLRCKSRPHFPLTCEQFGSWATKFELQYYLELSRKNPYSVWTCVCGSIMYQYHDKVLLQTCQDCGTEYTWRFRWKKGDPSVKLVNFADENTLNFISAEYSDVCLPIHELRFNVKAASDLKNHLISAEMDANHVQQFVSNFKLALHLIELGFAWLYLTRAQKKSEWATLKGHLTQLHSLVDSDMTSVKQALPHVEPKQKVTELKKLVDTIMNLFENV